MEIVAPSISLPSPDATTDFAVKLGRQLKPGDVLGLSGPLGAGKSHFTRAIIQDWQRRSGHAVEDVPSPTFTLVQTYRAGGTEIWHCDLYRLSAPSEVWELGLDVAIETAICLIEWPERLGTDWPWPFALSLSFSHGEDHNERHLRVSGNQNWRTRLSGMLT